MNRKYFFALFALTSVFIIRCGSNKQEDNENKNPLTDKETAYVEMGINSKGIGRFKDVKLSHPIDEAMVAQGQNLFSTKCFACHKLTEEKLVGPGWKGVTDRRTPEWILNFITNTQVMLDKDQMAQAMLVTCLVRMPSQDLSDDQARQVLEFMRKNDGKN